MSKSRYVTGLRAVEQLLASQDADIRRIYAEYQTANPRVEALIATANSRSIEIQPANRARLAQISGESRHQGIVAEVRRSMVLDEAGLRSLVEERLQADDGKLLLLLLDGVQDPHNLGACLRTADAAGVDAGVGIVQVAAGTQGHDHLFQGGVSGTFSNSIHGHFHLPGSIDHTAHGVGSGHAQVIMAMR